MNTILDSYDQMPYHTNLGLVFRALDGRQEEFNWLITNLEVNFQPDKFPYDERNQLSWLSGQELTAIAEQYDIQFIWAVLSGFKPDVTIDLNNLEAEPFADGNSSLWRKDVAIQHPEATVEIVCWDSAYTLLLSKDTDLSQRFRSFFPKAKDLNIYNRKIVVFNDGGLTFCISPFDLSVLLRLRKKISYY